MVESPDQRPDDDDQEEENLSLVQEFILFIRENKKWWLIPLISVFVLLTGVILLASNPATAPFLYSFF